MIAGLIIQFLPYIIGGVVVLGGLAVVWNWRRQAIKRKQQLKEQERKFQTQIKKRDAEDHIKEQKITWHEKKDKRQEELQKKLKETEQSNADEILDQLNHLDKL